VRPAQAAARIRNPFENFLIAVIVVIEKLSKLNLLLRISSKDERKEMPHNNTIPDAKLKFINGVSKNIP